MMKHTLLTERQAEVVERVAHGLTARQISAELHISVFTVRRHIEDAAARIPGDESPRYRITLFFLNVDDDRTG
jgi:FixJ family two-component response regulator